MRETVKELMERLGVGYVLGPYETCPWSYYDAEEGVTCSAEASMGGDSEVVEAEIQMMYDDPPEGKTHMEQVCQLRAEPLVEEKWTVTEFKIQGEDIDERIYNWEEKSCNFFAAVVQCLNLDELPDIEKLIELELSNERGADQRGGGGGRSQKMRKASQVLGVKKGGGM
jgi:hypothetical protein